MYYLTQFLWARNSKGSQLRSFWPLVPYEAAVKDVGSLSMAVNKR